MDKEALARGTSVYLVDRVVPMLPKELSNGICSLNPHEDRLTMSVFMEVDKNGKVVDYSIEEAVIRSKMRMVYEDVTMILEDGEKDPMILDQYRDFMDELRDAEELCKILNRERSKRGSIDFNLDETQIVLDEEGNPLI